MNPILADKERQEGAARHTVKGMHRVKGMHTE